MYNTDYYKKLNTCKGCLKSHFTVFNNYYKRTIKDSSIREITYKRGNPKVFD